MLYVYKKKFQIVDMMLGKCYDWKMREKYWKKSLKIINLKNPRNKANTKSSFQSIAQLATYNMFIYSYKIVYFYSVVKPSCFRVGLS